MKNKRLVILVSVVFLLLLIPLIAMQFTAEVKWELSDFAMAAILLFSAGLGLDFIVRKVKITKYRIALIVVLLVLFFHIWAELAVGIF